ncbi:capsular polysaccharide biosynthesis protein [Planomonospora parontospora subsp. parontospora]|uniref:Capsular polysaccharide biosynthesis protein n=2 Tax=Planomonospora parontospora TaxID=58119 RepID=A0AA37BJD9_9ACTN|nr:CapA family protein [Planomonospora parontospora]GGK80009.1 capsular polysaccharide biosynthesis protein [Planomonospora parontospora]GII11286.1 capsular polysaccharide biosynthesis protein [Planomonospora parontospora subsp. parontospora]
MNTYTRRRLGVAAAAVVSTLLAAACTAAESAAPDSAAGKPADRPAEPAEATPTPERRPYTISFGGDVHFEGVLRTRLNANPRTALGPIAKVLRKADLAMVNLETAITTGGTPAPGKQYTFRAPASALTALKAAGVDVASMANNHGMDYMESGLADSLAAVRRAKFPVVGVGANEAQAYRPWRTTVNGNRVAIIGATQVLDSEFITAWTAKGNKGGLASAKNEARLIQEVRRARRNSDTVIVHLHWGTELQKCPNEAQRSLAPKLVAAGADVVVGGHAHILLGGGYLRNAYVNYGMGNFVFYNWGPETGRTGVLTLTIDGRKVLKDQWTPAVIQGGVPVPLTGSARRQALTSWKALRGCTGLAARPGQSSD